MKLPIKEFKIKGYAFIEKVAGNRREVSARIYVPVAWKGKTVALILEEPIEEA